MFLTKYQKELLNTIHQFGPLRTDQMEKIIYLKFHQEVPVLQTIRVLVRNGYIKEANGFLFHDEVTPRYKMIDSVDIMLAVSGNTFHSFLPGVPPFTLTFFRNRDGNGHLYRYDICPVPVGHESLITAELEHMNFKYRAIIFFLEQLEQQHEIHFPYEHCYAIWKNGHFKFYK